MLARPTKSMRNKDKGFTLIELLVVIIIIGILAAIAIPIFLNQRKKGVDASIKSDVKNMATQVETFYTNSQKYPVPVGGTGPDIVGTSNPITVGGETVPVSSGNVLIYSLVGTTGYRICGSNPNGTATGASTDFFVYNSTTGGLAAGGPTACP